MTSVGRRQPKRKVQQLRDIRKNQRKTRHWLQVLTSAVASSIRQFDRAMGVRNSKQRGQSLAAIISYLSERNDEARHHGLGHHVRIKKDEEE